MSIRDRIPGEQRLRLRQQIHRIKHPAWMGNLRRISPLSDEWGRERGLPIDRYYIERFLETNRADIRGDVLEVKDAAYTRRFGTAVTRADVLDIDARNSDATIVADLARAESIPDNCFDCFVLTQTLQFVDDLPAAVAHTHRILKPGGVLLATLPAISRVERAYADSDYWRFNPAICSRLFGQAFGPSQISVQTFGNVLSAIAFLTGMAKQELTAEELDAADPYYPVIVGVRAVKH